VLDEKFVEEVERCTFTKQVVSNTGQLRLQFIVRLYLSDMHTIVYHWVKTLLPYTNKLYYYCHVPMNDTTTAMYL
jgi:hypothetical protein